MSSDDWLVLHNQPAIAYSIRFVFLLCHDEPFCFTATECDRAANHESWISKRLFDKSAALNLWRIAGRQTTPSDSTVYTLLLWRHLGFTSINSVLRVKNVYFCFRCNFKKGAQLQHCVKMKGEVAMWRNVTMSSKCFKLCHEMTRFRC